MPAYKVDTNKMYEVYLAMRTYSKRLEDCRDESDRVVAVLRKEKPLDELCDEVAVINSIISDCAAIQLKMAETLNSIITLLSEYENYIKNK